MQLQQRVGQQSSASGPASTSGRCTGRRTLPVVRSSRQHDGEHELHADPERKFMRYGRHFGGGFRLKVDDWLESAPRVRVRQASQRQKDELLELVALNERLAGETPAWEVRARLETLKCRRRNWEAIYNYVIKQDAAATLAMVEEAAAKAEELLSEEAQERTSVSNLRSQLAQLQAQIDEASQRLAQTQQRVEENVERVTQLRAEAASLEKLNTTAAASLPTGASMAMAAPAAVLGSTAAAMASSSSVLASSGGVVVAGGSSSRGTALAERPAAEASSAGSSSRPATAAAASASLKRSKGLHSSLDAEPALKEFWYPAEFSSSLKADTLVPFDLFDEPWVLFRDENGLPACIRDECAHRACPLSVGKVVNGQVACAYHGWEFNGAGACTKMPSTVQCKGVRVAALPCVEKDGLVWVWPGYGEPPEVPSTTAPPTGYQIHAEIKIDVPVEHGLLIENLLDLAHAPFTHTSTFARGWPVPDAVKFHAQQLLSGNWDPYPIDMAFQPPCLTFSTIGLAQPGKIMRGVRAGECQRHLHQMHICAPAKRGQTRLLYRMSMDFMPWARSLPFIDRLWKGVAGQVLGEDLVLVMGQQQRLEQGGDTWANPVSYDKLAVRYRRWRNKVAAEGAAGGPAGVTRESRQLVNMSAGDMFAIDSDDDAYVDERQRAVDAAAAARAPGGAQHRQDQPWQS